MKNIAGYYLNINWLLICIHVVASWLYVQSCRTLSLLYNVPLMEKVLERDAATTFTEEEIQAIRDYGFIFDLSPFAGMLTALLISLLVIQNKKFWINSILTFIILIISFRINIPIWRYAKSILLYPGSFFSSYTIRQLVNGIFLISLGTVIFIFSRKTLPGHLHK